jgi:hypothetical protein
VHQRRLERNALGGCAARPGTTPTSGPSPSSELPWSLHRRRRQRRGQSVTRGTGFTHFLPLVLLVFICEACSSQSTAKTAPTPKPASSTSSSPSPAQTGIVGKWERVVTCDELVAELSKAHLRPLATQAWSGQTSSHGQSSYRPGSPKPTPTHPCNGAIARTHSHFFNSSHTFGSLDWQGGQVDDGTYTATSKNVVIGKVTFNYRIVDGKTLYLTPVLTPAMIQQARSHPDNFSDAGWAVSVADAGHPWKRVPCDGWC